MFWQRGRAGAGLVATLVLGTTLAGCSAASVQSPGPDEPAASASSTPAPSSPAPSAPVTLSFGISGDATLRAAYRKLAQAYTNEHPDVTIEVERVPGDEGLAEWLQQEGAPDVFVASNAQAPALVENDLVQPVDQLLEDRDVSFGDGYQRLGLEAFSADQALQCMPYDVSPLVVFYNPGLVPFRRLVEPGADPLTPESGWTWEQFTEAARLMSRKGVKGVYVEPSLRTLMAFARSAGTDIVDDPREATTLTLSDDATRAALEEVLTVVRDPDLTPTARQLERRGAISRFSHEQIGMIIGTRALVPKLRKNSDFAFDVFPLPRLGRSRTVAEVTGYCLAADSAHTEAAADFVAFAAGERGSAILAETGAVVPANLPTLNSLSFTQPGEPPQSVLVFDDALEKATLVPFDPGWPELVAALQPDVARMFNEPLIDLDQLLPQMDERSRDFLEPLSPQ
ncbi:ABC transporter substrate-binding protein [Nocardioides mesophilus]|uniref:Extracellular solute-binding protein n=1 Tax=Nocardioides mesophilus TaxID=433659 RepID=A0A7G9RA11_9ACTN|nr:extracellular solute-binding protein [Nocardioides mesophilus]QNN52436.1 extracellular solute-binding protein [Nocardioides mesophilus]